MKTMEQLFMLLFLIATTVSCDRKEGTGIDIELTEKWKLIEILSDPGGGSGTFSKVESRKTIEFHSDGRITSNGSICEMSTEADFPSEGTFSLADSTINVKDCGFVPPFEPKFSYKDGFLFIYFPCRESCIEKYEKIGIAAL